jgi:hypothetical protein
MAGYSSVNATLGAKGQRRTERQARKAAGSSSPKPQRSAARPQRRTADRRRRGAGASHSAKRASVQAPAPQPGSQLRARIRRIDRQIAGTQSAIGRKSLTRALEYKAFEAPRDRDTSKLDARLRRLKAKRTRLAADLSERTQERQLARHDTLGESIDKASWFVPVPGAGPLGGAVAKAGVKLAAKGGGEAALSTAAKRAARGPLKAAGPRTRTPRAPKKLNRKIPRSHDDAQQLLYWMMHPKRMIPLQTAGRSGAAYHRWGTEEGNKKARQLRKAVQRRYGHKGPPDALDVADVVISGWSGDKWSDWYGPGWRKTRREHHGY